MGGSLILSLLFLLLPQPAQTQTSSKEFPFYPGGTLEIIASIPGNVRVIGWPKALVRVDIEKVIREPEQAGLDQVTVRVTHTQTLARISATSPGLEAEAHLVIYVPRQKTDLIIKMIRGDLSIGSMNGSVEATLEAGNIEGRDLTGYISGLTKAGDLNFDLAGNRWTGYGLSAVTRLGNVRLRVPSNYSAVLQLEAKEGDITVDFPDQLIDGESVPLQPVAGKKSRTLNAPVGSGGIPVRLATLSGNISLEKK